MKILFASNENPYFLNTNYYRQKALRELGHETVFFDVFPYLTSPRFRSLWPALQKWEDGRINRMLVRACAAGRFDLCLLVGGHTVAAHTVTEIRAAGTPVAVWTTDPPFPEHFRNIVDAAGTYDRIFCAGTEAVDILKAGGRCTPIWLPFCCDPACHAPQCLTALEEALYRRDIAFVGSYYPNRGKVFEVLSDHDIGIWGPLWKRLPPASPLKARVRDARLDFSAWTKIYSAAKIVLVVHYQDGRVPCHQASPNLFEAMACGAFVLCDEQKDVRSLFQDREHVVFFRDAEDLKQKVDHYLAHPEERARIAASGRREVLEKHTYRHRMDTIARCMAGEA